jgi:hypothetical protein
VVVNFRACRISRGARKLTRIPTLIIIIKKIQQYLLLNPHGDVCLDDIFITKNKELLFFLQIRVNHIPIIL